MENRASHWHIIDAVWHLDNGVLGGTYTYEWRFERALGVLQALLSECGIDASGLITYFSIEEVQQQT